jgi:hypothetical protein
MEITIRHPVLTGEVAAYLIGVGCYSLRVARQQPMEF